MVYTSESTGDRYLYAHKQCESINSNNYDKNEVAGLYQVGHVTALEDEKLRYLAFIRRLIRGFGFIGLAGLGGYVFGYKLGLFVNRIIGCGDIGFGRSFNRRFGGSFGFRASLDGGFGAYFTGGRPGTNNPAAPMGTDALVNTTGIIKPEDTLQNQQTNKSDGK